MRRTSRLLALGSMLGSLAFGFGALAQDGSEVDLTGTWESAQICDELIAEEFSDFVIVVTPLLVVQDGDTFRFLFMGEPDEKCKMSWEVPSANAKYTGQHAFDVGDVPGHQVRIFEVRRTFPDEQSNCEGLKQVEQWLRGYSDYVDRNGPSWGYSVTLLENGDKIFAEFSSAVQTVVSPDGSKKTEATTVHKWIGGTGKASAAFSGKAQSSTPTRTSTKHVPSWNTRSRNSYQK
jgi:hypothetical protein